MIRLEREDYRKAEEALLGLSINTIFAQSVLRLCADGEVYADRDTAPEAFYVLHPYGMALLFGKRGSTLFEERLANRFTNGDGSRSRPEWLQADPAGDWDGFIETVIQTHQTKLEEAGLPTDGDRAVLRNTRVNFRFNPIAYAETKEKHLQRDHRVVQTTAELFHRQSGAVVPRFFFRNAEHFLGEGVGFTALHGDEPAATAFSAYRNEQQLEIGIESTESCRGKGYAFAVCSALIDYCLENSLEPVWSCRLENAASHRLAQKLGFEPTVTLPYYRLPV
ncbi:GNAT family N-acetyltransferase [Paenibacillus sp. YN15]|uniref:GNAT family N-acetyltransferase n=1 Tax=Paenibacillus sp. YN15 TaxID=1742774 RepID=UPI000DCD04EE|nr:GNAT family N-acetyltransferase [Paenibacillus sp. YN15]RAU98676.1 GNAT family N-acetyltransferase [Paenibacillus sp. YN15]